MVMQASSVILLLCYGIKNTHSRSFIALLCEHDINNFQRSNWTKI